MITHLRYAVRSLVKSPAYTAIALITLALGIGVNTSMFSVVDLLLFRAAPYPQSDRLVQLAGVTRTGELRAFSEQEIREITPQADGFSSLTAVGNTTYSLAEPGRPAERVYANTASSSMLETFRVQPILGRSFAAEDFVQGKNQVVLLNESYWQSRFGGDRAIVGRTLRLDGESVTVIGVLPARAEYRTFWGNVALWRPLNYSKDQLTYRGYRAFLLIGRLKDGVTAQNVAAQLAPLAVTQQKSFPQEYADLRYRVMLLPEASMDEVGRGISWMLLGLSGFVLLIACANLANLQLARATASIREFAIRAALGASRTRLITQQLTECLLLSLAGGGLGLLVAKWVNHILEQNILIGGEPGLTIPIDAPILLIALLVSTLTGIVFGVVPALFASRTDVSSALKSQARGSTSGRGQHRMRHALIIGEVALALMLLAGAAIMNRGFAKFLDHPTGWDTDRILTGTVSMPEARFDTPEKRLDFFRKVTTKLSALPGVEHVALGTSLPLFSYSSERQVFVDASAASASTNPVASHVMITPDFFATLGIPLLQGRDIAPDLKTDGPPHILVSESLARQFWPNDSALGRRLGAVNNGTTTWYEIIGVVSDVDCAANIGKPPTKLTVYRPIVQEAWSFINIAVRSAHPETLNDTVLRAFAEIDPDLPVDQLGTIRQFVQRTQHNLVVVAQMLIGFAILGLVLAAVGLYGVISNIVVQRTSEFGIRLALGAQPGDVLSNVLNRGMQLTVIGLGLGLVGAYGLGRFLASFMPQLAIADPASLAVVSVLLFLVTVIASWLPARRATKVDPMIALRAE